MLRAVVFVSFFSHIATVAGCRCESEPGSGSSRSAGTGPTSAVPDTAPPGGADAETRQLAVDTATAGQAVEPTPGPLAVLVELEGRAVPVFCASASDAAADTETPEPCHHLVPPRGQAREAHGDTVSFERADALTGCTHEDAPPVRWLVHGDPLPGETIWPPVDDMGDAAVEPGLLAELEQMVLALHPPAGPPVRLEQRVEIEAGALFVVTATRTDGEGPMRALLLRRRLDPAATAGAPPAPAPIVPLHGWHDASLTLDATLDVDGDGQRELLLHARDRQGHWQWLVETVTTAGGVVRRNGIGCAGVD